MRTGDSCLAKIMRPREKTCVPIRVILRFRELCGLLIAISNEHPALDHQSVRLFSQIRLYLIKYLLQFTEGMLN